MRFKKQHRVAFTDTSRKRAALRRKQQKERETLPLFANQIAAEQPREDDVMQARAQAWAVHECRDRARRAAEWRAARARLAALPRSQERLLRRAWNCAPYPAEPAALAGFLHRIETGRVSLDDLPFPLTRTNPHGHRSANFFEMTEGLPPVSTEQARAIAAAPLEHRPQERLAGYHQLQAAARNNKNYKQGSKDRVLSAALYLKLEDIAQAVEELNLRASDAPL